MEVSDLVARLAELQIEQNSIIEQLANKARAIETKTEDKKQATQQKDTQIHTGDHVLLLTGGIKCNKGDRAKVTKVTDSSVHFTVLRNSHSTHKKHKNVKKIQQTWAAVQPQVRHHRRSRGAMSITGTKINKTGRHRNSPPKFQELRP